MKKTFRLKTTYSLKRILIYFCILFLAILIAGFLMLAYYLAGSTKKFVTDSYHGLLNGYANNLNNWVDNLYDFNMNVSAANYDFQALNKKSTDQKLLHENNLRKTLSYRTCPTGAIFIYDMSGDVELYRFGADYTARDFLENVALKRYLIDYCREVPVEQYYKWFTMQRDGKIYLLNIFNYGTLNVCSMIDLDRTSANINRENTDDSIHFAFSDGNAFLSDLGKFSDISYDRVLQKDGRMQLLGDSYVLSGENLGDTKVSLCVIEKVSLLNSYSRLAFGILIIVFGVLIIMILVLFHMMTRYLFYPLYQIGTASELLMQANGEKYNEIFTGEEKKLIGSSLFQIVEVEQINLALFDLMQKKINLEKENERRQKEEEHAQLQYYQLQTRSHFFLNCLKSLYAMLESGQYQRMQRMIIAFSNHIRYVFHDNMMEVSLRQEMTEVNDYYNIIVMDREKPVILIQNVEEELMDLMVPPLVVQTFLENSMKYSAAKDKVLQVVITAEKQMQSEKECLRLKIVDNGKGFSYDDLERLNSTEDYSYEQYHVGINNLKRRLQLIYRGDFSIHFYNDLNGGACVTLYLPIEIVRGE